MMRRTAGILAILLMSVVSAQLFARISIENKGQWPESWPEELEPLREKSRTIEGPLSGFLKYEIPFSERDEFESAWPHFLKVRNAEYPITLVRSPHGDVKAGVVITSSTIASKRTKARTIIVVVVDGDIVDLNRLQLPENTRIQDERFKDDGISKP